MAQIIKTAYEIKDWSGGTTTEIFIYPEGAEYDKKNFSFRLSTASVEVDESTFTELPGVSRTLMVLHGKMKLSHEGQHTRNLEQHDVDVFDGGWKTTSKGQCVDFNLMCRGETRGKVRGFALEKNRYREIAVDGKVNFIYVTGGTITINRKSYHPGALLRIKLEAIVQLQAKDHCDFVVVEIFNP
ncbi:MAG: environmental stress-induced protein Ves [Arenicella sp.]|jgi:environmental stress-induced protein Ves